MQGLSSIFHYFATIIVTRFYLSHIYYRRKVKLLLYNVTKICTNGLLILIHDFISCAQAASYDINLTGPCELREWGEPRRCGPQRSLL